VGLLLEDVADWGVISGFATDGEVQEVTKTKVQIMSRISLLFPERMTFLLKYAMINYILRHCFTCMNQHQHLRVPEKGDVY
jgi:hypothetical protein